MKCIILPVKYYKILLSLFLLVLNIPVLLCQPGTLDFKNYYPDDGFPHATYNAIVHDNLGYTWAASGQGLVRFDGYQPKVYQHNNSVNSLSSSECYSLLIDKNNTLWIGTKNGLNRYNPLTDDFTQYRLPVLNKNTALSNQFFRGLITDNDGNPVFIDEAGTVCTYNYKINELELLLNKPVENNVKSVYIDKNNIIWAGTRNGLAKVDVEKQEINYYQPATPTDKFEVWSIAQFGNTLWLVMLQKSNIYTFNTSTRQFGIVENFHDSVFEYPLSILKDSMDNVWFGSSEGIIQYNLNDNTLRKHLVNNSDTAASDNTIINVTTDNYNNIWVARTNGISVAHLHNNFVAYRNREHKLHVPVVSLTLDTNGICYTSGFSYDLVQQFNLETGKVQQQFKVDEFFGLNKGNVQEMYTHSNGDIFIGTYSNGLTRFNPYTKSYTTYKPAPGRKNKLTGPDIRDIEEDRNGKLWMISHGYGFNQFDPSTGKFTTFSISDSDFRKMGELWCFDMAIDTGQIVWLAHTNGFSSFNPKNGKFQHFSHNPYDTTTVSNNSARGGITIDAANNLWIGTDFGLNFFNRKTKKFVHFGEQNILPSSIIKFTIFDNDSNLWVGHDQGISRLQFLNKVTSVKANIQVKNYKWEDGIGSYSMSSTTCYKDKKGNILMGGNSSLLYFNPSNIQDNTLPPILSLTSITINNKQVEINQNNTNVLSIPTHINYLDKIELAYNQNQIGITYVGINYYQPYNTQYAYKLEGHDHVWNNVGNERKAIYRNLPPGRYTFRLKAANSDGYWTPNEKKLDIVVLPPWWKTWWFRLFIYLIAVALVALLFWVRIKLLQKQKQVLQAEVNRQTNDLLKQTEELSELNTQLEERQQFIEEQREELEVQKEELTEKNSVLTKLNATKDTLFSIIAHDLKNPFSSVIGLLELLRKNYDRYTDEKRNKFLDNIAESADSIYKLLENLLYWARSQTKSIDFDPLLFPLNEIITSNINLYRSNAHKKGITLVNNIPNDINIFGDKRMLDTVIRNLLNNAIKYTNNGTVKFSIQKAKSNICIIIADTGKGMTKEKAETLFEVKKNKSTPGTSGERGTGLGLIICNEFVQYHNGSIEVESEIDKGSRFLITLPI